MLKVLKQVCTLEVLRSRRPHRARLKKGRKVFCPGVWWVSKGLRGNSSRSRLPGPWTAVRRLQRGGARRNLDAWGEKALSNLPVWKDARWSLQREDWMLEGESKSSLILPTFLQRAAKIRKCGTQAVWEASRLKVSVCRVPGSLLFFSRLRQEPEH